MIHRMVLLVSVALCPAAFAAHSPLLPRPQQVQYGAGSVQVRSFHVSFASAPNEDDRFAADQLRSRMKAEDGPEVSIGEGERGGEGAVTVVLDREGAEDEPLAMPGDQPGPNSHEAYDLAVTNSGVKIHSRPLPASSMACKRFTSCWKARATRQLFLLWKSKIGLPWLTGARWWI